jgi:hypothetical protein
MDDIVYRLRNWVIAVHAPPVSDLMDEAADEIERLRGYRNAAEADRDIAMLAAERLRNGAVESRETVVCPYVVGRTTRYCSLTPFTLTDEERAAISWAAGLSDTRPSGCRTTLRSLLERASKWTADGRESDQ